MSAEVLEMLIETANAVFGGASADPWSDVAKAGFLELPELSGIVEIAEVVRVSAYHGTEIEFAERMLLDPLRAAGVSEADIRGRGALMRSVQILGALERARDITVAYASERRQFGQPLNRFQAVQQQLAELAGEVELAGAAVRAALIDESVQSIAVAKIVTGRAASTVGAISHQVHGAIGMTREHPLHHFTTRLWKWRDEFGTETSWAHELGLEITSQGSAEAWSMVARR